MTIAAYVDTNVFISAFESTGRRSEEIWRVFEAIEAGEFGGVTSELTIAELLPKPLSLGQNDLSDVYLQMLSGVGGIRIVPVSREILIHTAKLRSQHGTLKLPDAVHLATAVRSHCPVMLSNDRRMPLPAGMNIRRHTI